MKDAIRKLCDGTSFVLTATMASITLAGATSTRQMERIDRGVVAINQGIVEGNGTVYVGWRLLAEDPGDATFDVYRKRSGEEAEKLNRQPVTETTDFVDREAGTVAPGTRYFVVPAGDAVRDTAPSFGVSPQSLPYLAVKLDPMPGYTANDCSVGDLDGDGQYEIVLKWDPLNSKDNSRSGQTDAVYLDALKLDGTRLWRIDLGLNVRAGAHYTQFMAYDLDGDGKAEVVCKTADGTVDGRGKVIGDASKQWRSDKGRILRGPEYLTCFSGETGAAISTVDYVSPRHPDKLEPVGEELKPIWGDGYGNRSDRFLAAVAYLDGRNPSAVMCRGYYTRSVLAAWDLVDGELKQRWVFDSQGMDKGWSGQGNHNLSVADVDGDGRDEIMYGSMCVDDDGTGLYTTRLGHGDAAHLSDMDPSRPGLENWTCLERAPHGAALWDAKTGEILVRWEGPKDTGRACAADIDPRHPGYELWASTGCPLFNVKGEVLSERHKLPVNFVINWDDDDLQELLDGVRILKYDWETGELKTLLDGEAYDCVSNNGTKATPCLSADLLGDYREEVVWRTADSSELRIFTTTIPAQRRLVTLMQDPQYRLSVAWQNVAYNQPPHTSFYLGHGMNGKASDR